jgi:serine/threonine protein kinase
MSVEQLTGKRLGEYKILELLGSGGMASVYKGYDPALDRHVAIKTISTVNQAKDFAARFQREARVVASLRHNNIVQIYHFGEQDDILYMVQELLSGPTLEQRIRNAGRRRIGQERVHSIMTQLAAALDVAHAQNIIHRDVKPSNALYNDKGDIVLTDFGIARSPMDMTRTATGPGVVMGTPGYLAPEQAISSTTLTPACDIYSLGVVLFELLTGQLPFQADTPMGVVLKHLYDEPPAPSSLRSDLPKAVDAIVLKALDKDPEKRYNKASELASALIQAWPITKGTPKAASTASATEKEMISQPVAVKVYAKPASKPAAAKAEPIGKSAKTDSAKATPKQSAVRATPKSPSKPLTSKTDEVRANAKPSKGIKEVKPAKEVKEKEQVARVVSATPTNRRVIGKAQSEKVTTIAKHSEPKPNYRGSVLVGLITLLSVAALLFYGYEAATVHSLIDLFLASWGF